MMHIEVHLGGKSHGVPMPMQIHQKIMSEEGSVKKEDVAIEDVVVGSEVLAVKEEVEGIMIVKIVEAFIEVPKTTRIHLIKMLKVVNLTEDPIEEEEDVEIEVLADIEAIEAAQITEDEEIEDNKEEIIGVAVAAIPMRTSQKLTINLLRKKMWKVAKV